VATVTIERAVSADEAKQAVEAQLGAGYRVTIRRTATSEVLTVRRSPISWATIHISRDEAATALRVGGGGLLILRALNTGLAGKVADALRTGLAPPGAG
jgi:hypothetical protein